MLIQTKIKGGKINAHIPAYRVDILHPIDIIEDVAIGYGYDNFEPVLPEISTVGGLTDLEKYTRRLREMMVGLGFQELSNFVLTSNLISIKLFII